MKKPIYLYKALKKGLESKHGKHKWKVGKWYKIEGGLSMCDNGFHASENIIDAMKYVKMECLAKVEVRGANLKHGDKQCWSEMRVVKTWKWEKEDSVRLSIYSASLVLKNFEAVNAARTAAVNAARTASAASVAWSIESAALESAARAAESVARVASAATKLKCHKWIIRRIKKELT